MEGKHFRALYIHEAGKLHIQAKDGDEILAERAYKFPMNISVDVEFEHTQGEYPTTEEQFSEVCEQVLIQGLSVIKAKFKGRPKSFQAWLKNVNSDNYETVKKFGGKDGVQ